MGTEINNDIPTEMTMTVASARKAIEYYLNNVIMRSEVKIKNVTFTREDHFKITFDREIEKPS